MMEIKLAPYKDINAKIFLGYEKGEYARKKLKLDLFDKSEESIRVLIPIDTWGINSSFFDGLFGNSIRYLKEKFVEKYQFVFSNGNELDDALKQNIFDNISYLIMRFNVL